MAENKHPLLLSQIERIASEHPETRKLLVPVLAEHTAALTVPIQLIKKNVETTLAYADSWHKEMYFTQFAEELAAKKRINLPPKIGKDAWFKRLEVMGYALRDLNYKAKAALNPYEWVALFSAICPDYNEFKAVKVGKFFAKFPGIQIIPAREGSVCAYVVGDRAVLDQMAPLAEKQASADESWVEESGRDAGQLRIWWD